MAAQAEKKETVSDDREVYVSEKRFPCQGGCDHSEIKYSAVLSEPGVNAFECKRCGRLYWRAR